MSHLLQQSLRTRRPQQPGDGDILNEETQAGKQGKDLDEESTPMQEKAEASSKSSHSLEQN